MPKNVNELQIKGDERLELLFRQLGLSEKQAKIYRVLLGRKTARAALLSKKSGINRSNTYVLLTDLVKRGLVRELSKGQVKSFQAVEPMKLLQIAKQRQRDLEAAGKLAEEMVPELTKEWKASVGRPVVKYLSGKEGLMEAFEDIYSPSSTEVYGCVDSEVVDQVFPEHILGELIPKRVEYGIKAYGVLAESVASKRISQEDEVQLRETVLLDKKEFPLPAEIEVYQDKVAMMSFAQKEMVGVILENADFAVSLRSLFKRLYELQRELVLQQKMHRQE